MQSETLRTGLALGRMEVSAPNAPVPSFLLSHLGAGLFGVAMAFSAASGHALLSVAVWAVALPLVGTCTWLICLPALYIPWAAREPNLTVSSIGRAASSGVAVFGTCLGATAPIQWFFAVTAPSSTWLRGLGFIFVWLALVAATVGFARALRAQSLNLPGWAQVLFFTLSATTFFQFAHIAGLHFFGA